MDQRRAVATILSYASESGRWYHKDGRPCETVMGANGVERAATLRDARKLDLLPSTTSILKVLARPGLDNWKIEQSILSALTLPRHGGETDQEFISRIKFDSKEKARKAAERGTALHTAIEKWLSGQAPEARFLRHCEAVERVLSDLGLKVADARCEKSFALPEKGYGGRVDLHFFGPDWVLDIKSKPTIEDGKKLAWPEHPCQLSAYGMGLGMKEPRCANIFVGIDDARVVAVEHEAEALQKGLTIFALALKLWQAQNGF